MSWKLSLAALPAGSIPSALPGARPSLRVVFGVALLLSAIKLIGTPDWTDVLGGGAVVLVPWMPRRLHLRRISVQEAT
jgi:hypothetical protein